MSSFPVAIASHTLPQVAFEQLRAFWQEMARNVGEEAVAITEDNLVALRTPRQPWQECFNLLRSPKFSALLWAIPAETPLIYKVGLTFDPNAIAHFLSELPTELQQLVTNPIANDPVIQSEFTLSLISLLSSNSRHLADDSPYSHAAVCQPLVEEALLQQIEQERLINQVTAQMRQSLELPVILETAVEQVRHFLQVDRLLIYQFNCHPQAPPRQLDPPTFSQISYISPVSSELGWGCVTYEATASEEIPSVLHFTEADNCFSHVPRYSQKYRQGAAFAIDDVQVAYSTESCLLEILQQNQVRAKLVAPIIVQEKLWGLLIAHQCFTPRRWQDSEKIFFEQIAGNLAVAIWQAQLYAQMQQQNHTLEQRVIERTQELRDALQAAQAASRAKSEFLAAMSHELRTPLTCVIGMSATLLRWSYGQEAPQALSIQKQRSYLETIQESGEHLLELINDILDLSQVEAGKAILNISEFSLTKMAYQTLRTLQEKAVLQEVNLKLDFQVKPHGDRFCADQRRVKQILFNLLGNAIKFTPSGGQVILRIWREDDQVVFQVEDTGIGIPEHQISLLFQKFQQLETPYQRNYNGIGLGLALTKQWVELHGGRIEVESTVEQGSSFTVLLPN
ncbi:MAG: GAF domain-containing sensor histidine kinase [Kastovskya adunca ATA6-11-RM4]|jgi:two-component system sensor histidine kinase/response regulator|nr:GAF domain-containing sensor histidine kinase [Kastovskya adunca ATA6-11-RM4]